MPSPRACTALQASSSVLPKAGSDFPYFPSSGPPLQRCFRAYPLLAAIWSPLFLAASNASEWIRVRDLVWPVAISVAAAAVAWLIAALLTSDPDKRALVAFVGVLAFVGYGTLSRTFTWVPVFATIGPSATT
jgi:hypothetical protein